MLEATAGPAHPLTAYTKANLADFLRLAGRITEARPLAKEALKDLRQTLPTGHRYVQWAREVIANFPTA